MPASPQRILLRRLAWFAATSVMGSGCDLGSKHLAETALASTPGGTISVAAPWLDLSLRYNAGTAFSVVGDLGEARWWLGLLALAMVVMMAVLAARADADRGDRIALGAVAGGAIGNGVDRILRSGAGGEPVGVVDFIKINYPWSGSWPSFNVADALIAVGVGVLLLRRWRRPDAPPPATSPF